MSDLLKIGLSAGYFHEDPMRPIFKGKTLMYFEKSMAEWVMQGKALPLLLPDGNGISVKDVVDNIDGLLLQGGSDVSPKSYGEEPMNEKWQGDFIRDQYETRLINECLQQDKPIFGVCRGLQILNVALGGTLYQDIETQIEGAKVHRDWHQYDELTHDVCFTENSWLSEVYPNQEKGKIVSIHHQSIKGVARDCKVDAISKEDKIIEAFHLESDRYARAVQWHPEFQKPNNKTLLDKSPLFKNFLEAVREKK